MKRATPRVAIVGVLLAHAVATETLQRERVGGSGRTLSRHFDDDNDETRERNQEAYDRIYNPATEGAELQQAAEDTRSSRLQEQVNSLFEYLAAQNEAMDALKKGHEETLSQKEVAWQAVMSTKEQLMGGGSNSSLSSTASVEKLDKCGEELREARRSLRVLQRTDSTRIVEVRKLRAEVRQAQAQVVRADADAAAAVAAAEAAAAATVALAKAKNSAAIAESSSIWAREVWAQLLLLFPACLLWAWHSLGGRAERLWAAQLHLHLPLPHLLLPRFLCACYVCLAAVSLALGRDVLLPGHVDNHIINISGGGGGDSDNMTPDNQEHGKEGGAVWWSKMVMPAFRANLTLLFGCYAITLGAVVFFDAKKGNGGGHPAYDSHHWSARSPLAARVTRAKYASRATQLGLAGLVVLSMGLGQDPLQHNRRSPEEQQQQQQQQGVVTEGGTVGGSSGNGNGGSFESPTGGLAACFVYLILAAALAFAAWLESFVFRPPDYISDRSELTSGGVGGGRGGGVSAGTPEKSHQPPTVGELTDSGFSSEFTKKFSPPPSPHGAATPQGFREREQQSAVRQRATQRSISMPNEWNEGDKDAMQDVSSLSSPHSPETNQVQGTSRFYVKKSNSSELPRQISLSDVDQGP